MAKPIGEMQGAWSLLLKIVLALAPVYAAADIGAKGWFVLEHFALRERVVVIETQLKLARLDIPGGDFLTEGNTK